MTATNLERKAKLRQAHKLADLWEQAVNKRILRLTVREKLTFLIETFDGVSPVAAALHRSPRTIKEWSSGLVQPSTSYHWTPTRIDQTYRMAYVLYVALGRQAAFNFLFMPQETNEGKSWLNTYYAQNNSYGVMMKQIRKLLLSAAKERLLGEDSDEAILTRLTEIRMRREAIIGDSWWVTEDLSPEDPSSAIGISTGEASDSVMVVVTPGTGSFDISPVEQAKRERNADFVAHSPGDIDWLISIATRQLAYVLE